MKTSTKRRNRAGETGEAWADARKGTAPLHLWSHAVVTRAAATEPSAAELAQAPEWKARLKLWWEVGDAVERAASMLAEMARGRRLSARAWDSRETLRSALRHSSRNRVVPRLMSAREVQQARPGLDLFGAVARSSKLREWHVQAFARKHGERGFAITLPDGKEAIVHQETAHGPLHRAWRATYFDAEGPTGHVYASGYTRKSDPPGGYLGVLRRLVREDDADLRGVRFQPTANQTGGQRTRGRWRVAVYSPDVHGWIDLPNGRTYATEAQARYAGRRYGTEAIDWRAYEGP